MQIDYWKISGKLIILAGLVGLTDFFIIQNQTDILKYLPVQLLHLAVGYSLLQKRDWAFNIARIFVFLNIISFAMFLPKTVSSGVPDTIFYIRTSIAIIYSVGIIFLWLKKQKR